MREISGIRPLSAGLKDSAIACLASIVLIYSLLLGIGHALFEQWTAVFGYMAAILISGFVVQKMLPRVIRKLREVSPQD